MADLQVLGMDVSEAATAQGLMCTVMEVARAALVLASDEASFVNRAHVVVDTGFRAK